MKMIQHKLWFGWFNVNLGSGTIRFPHSDHTGLQWQQNHWMLNTAKFVVICRPSGRPFRCLPPSSSSILSTEGPHVTLRNLHWSEGWMFHVWLN